MKQLNQLLLQIPTIQTINYADDISIERIIMDSRVAANGDLFVAISGTQSNGHDYIDQVISKGARVIVCEVVPNELSKDICYIQVENSAKTLGILASNFYDQPSKKLTIVGITGTNGKTSTATMLYILYRKLGYKVGLLSTIKIYINDQAEESTHTTPNAIVIQQKMKDMVDAGCTHCFMEVSSHALDQYRTEGIEFKGGVFTNLTHEHLDYHQTFDHYLAAKKKFFDEMPANAFSLINLDSKYGQVMVQNTKSKVVTYAMKTTADYTIRVAESNLVYMSVYIDAKEVMLKVVGEFNAYNALACYAVARELGENQNDILIHLSQINPIEGRLEAFTSPYQTVIGVVDFAHTPDAVEKVLDEINKNKQKGHVITVIGCGGNRDKQKRPTMAKIASEKSTKVILTSDNPRNEDPKAIIDDMKEGLSPELIKKCLTVIDRHEAIRTACMLAEKDDIVAVLGKGHEKYQETQGVKTPFDDKEELWNTFKELNL